VIVARSYVSMSAAGSNPSDPAADSRPDDYSARDLGGHGTAVASIAAGVPTMYKGNTVVGVAPKAFLGSYKIYGAPELYSGPTEAEVLKAFDDAVADGMDVINFLSGAAAFGGPLDTGAACGLLAGQPCDPVAWAVEQIVKNGAAVVVAAAGNEGADGYNSVFMGTPSFGTISSPGTAPSVLTAGGIENDIGYAETVQVQGTDVPANLTSIVAYPSYDGSAATAAVTAPLIDVGTVGSPDGQLCTGLGGAQLDQSIALILRGTCTFDTKIINAQNAGAIGVIFRDDGRGVDFWGGIPDAYVPAFLISQSDGQNLKNFIDGHPGRQVTMNPNSGQVPAINLGYVPESVAYFASRGPATGSHGLKPDITAVATSFLLAAQSYDCYGDLYSPDRYSIADGTSFSAPMLAGAAALVKQANPKLTPLQIKSALVNTATLTGLLDQDGLTPASISEVGAGLLQAQNAVGSTIQLTPSSVSFGLLSGALSAAQTVTISNTGVSSKTLTFTVAQAPGLGSTLVKVNDSGVATITVGAGETAAIKVSMTGSVPTAGRYEGAIGVAGASVPISIPYMFVVSDHVAYNVIPLGGMSFDGLVGQPLPAVEQPFAIRLIDQWGAPVANAPVEWTATEGGGSILSGADNTTTTTDVNGIAYASVKLGPNAGSQQFQAAVAGFTVPFAGYAREQAVINDKGVVDAASFTGERAVAPGSIISVFGLHLSDYEDGAQSLPLPLGLDGVAVSFDVPSAGISIPGRIYYAGPTQLNVQVPWELAGQPSAIVKVIVNYTYSAEYNLPLAPYAPGIFAYTSGGQQLAAALDVKYHLIGTSNPAAVGSAIQLYLNGLGPVNHAPQTGSAGPNDATATTTVTPEIKIGGQIATVLYSGLAPGYAGLYQVNAIVPDGVASGMQPVTCSIGGVDSAPVFLAIQ
ncbi:MAG: S8 family serine peptidase, partial [Bryobacteraceae bacterium]